MILKILNSMTVFALGCGLTFVIVFCIYTSFCLLECCIAINKRIVNALKSVDKFARFAELFYGALDHIPDETIRSEFRKKWEGELCQK